MSGIDSGCPQDANLTDCLLRMLLNLYDKKTKDDDEKFNWDPVTFGFTAPVGLLAAIFALASVYAAVMAAAGPGRRKSSARAIGEWSTKTRRRWHWRGLTWESTAYTPVLRLSGIKRMPEMTAGDTNTTASWVGFLNKMGSDPTITNPQEVPHRETSADYLPADILAAPAYAEAGFIVTAAACAGADQWHTDAQSPYPVMVGDSFQFDFRQHPVLGVVGAFSQYGGGTGKTHHSWTPRKRMSQDMHHAAGDVALSELLAGPRGKNEPEIVSAISRPNPEIVLNLVHRGCGSTTPQLCSQVHLYTRHGDHHLLWLLVGKTPNYPPALFPSRVSREPNLLSVLALSSKFWATARWGLDEGDFQDVFSDMTWSTKDNSLPALVEPADLTEEWNPMKKATTTPTVPGPVPDLPAAVPQTNPAQADWYLHLLQASVRLVNSYDEFRAWFNGFHHARKSAFRDQALLQLQRLDDWLASLNNVKIVRCRATALFLATTTLLDIEWAFSKGLLELHAKTKKGSSSSSPVPPLADSDNPPTTVNSGARGHAVSQHSTLLEALSGFLHDGGYSGMQGFPPAAEPETRSTREKEAHYLASHSPGELLRFAATMGRQGEPLPSLSVLVQIIDPACQSWRAWAGNNPLRMGRPADGAAGHAPTREDRIDMVLVWRCLLMAMLFWTAPDNSDVLLSGLWQHIVPVI